MRMRRKDPHRVGAHSQPRSKLQAQSTPVWAIRVVGDAGGLSVRPRLRLGWRQVHGSHVIIPRPCSSQAPLLLAERTHASSVLGQVAVPITQVSLNQLADKLAD